MSACKFTALNKSHLLNIHPFFSSAERDKVPTRRAEPILLAHLSATIRIFYFFRSIQEMLCGPCWALRAGGLVDPKAVA